MGGWLFPGKSKTQKELREMIKCLALLDISAHPTPPHLISTLPPSALQKLIDLSSIIVRQVSKSKPETKNNKANQVV